jgi:hypothetical protein
MAGYSFRNGQGTFAKAKPAVSAAPVETSTSPDLWRAKFVRARLQHELGPSPTFKITAKEQERICARDVRCQDDRIGLDLDAMNRSAELVGPVDGRTAQSGEQVREKADLYNAFPAAEARRLVERFEWHYTNGPYS